MKKFLYTIVVLVLFAASIGYSQLAGDYYIGAAGTGPGATDPDFATLKAACDAINAGTITGNCTFYITSDLTEPTSSHLGVNTAGYSITFKPSADADRTITFEKATDNTASSGGLVIGLSADNWANLVVTDNIIIDGYADGGATRRLALVTSSTAFTAHTPIHIIGDVNNVTIKNCSLTVNQTTGTAAFGSVSMRCGNWSSSDYLPDNIVIDNCIINSSTPSGAGIFTSYTTSGGGATPVGRPIGLEFKNNSITVKHRAVSLNYSGTSSVYNNEISVNQPSSGFASFGIGGTSAGLVTTNVYNNKITQLATGNIAGLANGIRGIQASGGGTWNIFNNFITGFSTPATGTTELLGIRCGSASNIYHNTIIMNNVTTTGGGTQPTSGIVTFTTSCDIRDNIIITEEDDFTSYCIYASSLPTTSDYNNLYRSGTVNAKIGYYTAAQATLLDWQTATGLDANSISKEVSFVSATDLHLTGASNGDFDLACTPIVGITTDIDGDTRNATNPYKGADEGTIPLEIITIAEAIEDLNSDFVPDRVGQTVTVQGVVFSPNYQTTNNSYYISDGTAGTDIFMYSPPLYSWNMGDELKITGVVTQYNGMSEIVPTDSTGWVLMSSGNPTPDPIVITLAQFKANAELYEGSLVGFVSLNKVSGTWPVSGSNSNLYLSDGIDTVVFRIDSDTDIDGQPEPAWPADIIGIGSQYDNSAPYNSGYQVFPRFYATDFLPAGTIPVELTSFIASVSGNSAILNWSTATETNNSGFEVERKSTSSSWTKVGFVPGFGTTTDAKQYSFADNNLTVGTYSYRLKQIDFNGMFEYSTVVEVDIATPSAFDLAQNYPNPFNPNTVIEYSVAAPVNVTLTIYSVLGEQVAVLVNNQFTEAGKYTVQFNASSLASGTYIYRLQAGNFVSTKKMLLMK